MWRHRNMTDPPRDLARERRVELIMENLANVRTVVIKKVNTVYKGWPFKVYIFIK